MLKKFCCIIVFVITVLNISFSQQQDCVFKLQEAEKLYSQGLIEEIPQLLNPCIESGLSQEDKLQAYKLVILSYLFNDEQVDAEDAMLSFLKRYPEYEISPTDPTEFVYLFESFSKDLRYRWPYIYRVIYVFTYFFDIIKSFWKVGGRVRYLLLVERLIKLLFVH